MGTGALAVAAWVLDPRHRPARAAAGWAAALALGALLEPCVAPQDDRYGPILFRGKGEERVVALTFDDGPLPPYTRQVLDLLRAEGVRASFFVVGSQVQRHPELVERMHREGHLVGNHTFNHANLALCSPLRSLREIEGGARAVEEVLGQPPEWFRPPYGARFPWTLVQVRRCGHRTAMWSVSPHDFLEPGADFIAERTLRDCHPGAIVLLHDGNGDRSQTVAALPRVLAGLRERGYRFVRVDDLG